MYVYRSLMTFYLSASNLVAYGICGTTYFVFIIESFALFIILYANQ